MSLSQNHNSSSAADSKRRPQSVYPMAVIELGTSAIRMAIGETDGVSKVRMLEQLVRGVAIGKDTFTRREIKRDTLRQCIQVLKSYRRKLAEYQCTNPSHIRVVATSAVREASNRLSFLDRIYTATGFVVEPIDDAEIARVTYLGIRPLLDQRAELRDTRSLLMEVGGGSTDILLLRGRNILHSQSYRLGTVRLQQLIRQYDAARDQALQIITGQIDRTLEQLRDFIPQSGRIELLAIGGDVRFAARHLQPEDQNSQLQRIPLRKLERLAADLSRLTTEQIMRTYHMELTQAETVAPALLAYVRMARMLDTDQVLVTNFNLRDALLQEMLQPSGWSTDLSEQIIRSADDLARHFQVDLQYSYHVANLARELFRQLASHHSMDVRCETILYVGALLHECGLFVSTPSYHKHSNYLISNSDIFGLNSLDHTLAALVARYHRRAFPKPSHTTYAQLDRESRVILTQMAAILRLAIALAHSRTQRIRSIECQVEKGRLIIIARGRRGDLSMEQLELRQNSPLFEEVFGMSVLLRESTI